MRPRGSDDWGQEDWRAPHDIRANHDVDQDWVDREDVLEQCLGYVFGLFALLGLWKILDLAFGGLGSFARFLGRILS
jgi:hypothetical protein